MLWMSYGRALKPAATDHTAALPRSLNVFTGARFEHYTSNIVEAYPKERELTVLEKEIVSSITGP